MDPVTHTLCGVAIGEAFFREKRGRRAVWAAALGANLPDIDALVHLSGDPASIVWRRGFGHSLLLLPFWAWAAAELLKRRWPDMERRSLLTIIGANVLAHLLLDLINSFGVQLLWPLSPWRPELAIVFIVDLALAGLLAAPHLARLLAAARPMLPRAARAGLTAAAVYLLACHAARRRAFSLLRAAEPAAGFAYVFPEPFGPLRWHGVALAGTSWREYLIKPLDGSASLARRAETSPEDPAVAAARDTPFGRRLSGFFKAPVWSVEREAGGGALVDARDLRFSPLTLSRVPAFSFRFDVAPDGRAARRGAAIW